MSKLKLSERVYRGYAPTYYDQLVQYARVHKEFRGHVLNVALHVVSNREDYSSGFYHYCFDYLSRTINAIQNGGNDA